MRNASKFDSAQVLNSKLAHSLQTPPMRTGKPASRGLGWTMKPTWRFNPADCMGRVNTCIGVPFVGYADLSRLTMADMVYQSARLLRPLVDALERHVTAGERMRAHGTVVPGLEPGLDPTWTARLWVYVLDDRPFAAPDPAAVVIATPRTAKASTREHIRASSTAFSSC